mgnify:CR=1 FL=1
MILHLIYNLIKPYNINIMNMDKTEDNNPKEVIVGIKRYRNQQLSEQLNQNNQHYLYYYITHIYLIIYL